MIKQLEYKFIAINMSFVTAMLLVIFGLVYYFTEDNIESDDITMMMNIADDPYQLYLPGNTSENIRLPFFALLLDSYGKLESITPGGSFYDLSDEMFLMELATCAIEHPNQTGILEEYDLRFYKAISELQQTIVFTDISSELAVLKNLIRSCAVIGTISFLSFFALSIFLAKWAVRPVARAWEQQRQFVADASHELKTPLTVIMTNAELIQNSNYAEGDRTRFVAAILTMSHQMRALVEQLLELARADNVTSKITFYEIDLSNLVSDALLPFEPVFFENGLTINAEIEQDVVIRSDAGRLRQVIDILLDNAQKYSSNGGTTRVKLCRKGKNKVLLSVANEGDEIPREDLQNLFKRFYRADKARSRDGSFGLGLSIAGTIIEQHGGKIWAESRMGINTFYVELRC